MGFMILSASAAELYEKFYSDIPQQDFEEVLRMDPTLPPDVDTSKPFGKFSKQLLTWYRKEGMRALDGMFSYLQGYDRSLADLPPEYRDIGRFKTVESFTEFVAFDMAKLAEKAKEEKAKAGVEKVYEDGTWLVVIPKTYEASVYYGRNTEWCTARPSSSNYFNQYVKSGTLYMILHKANFMHSIQLFVPSDSGKKLEIRDYQDEDFDIRNIAPEVKDVLVARGIDLVGPLPDAYICKLTYVVFPSSTGLGFDGRSVVVPYRSGNAMQSRADFRPISHWVEAFKYRRFGSNSMVEAFHSADVDPTVPGIFLYGFLPYVMARTKIRELTAEVGADNIRVEDEFPSLLAGHAEFMKVSMGVSSPYLVWYESSWEGGFSPESVIGDADARDALSMALRALFIGFDKAHGLEPFALNQVSESGANNALLISTAGARPFSEALEDEGFLSWTRGRFRS